MKVDFLFVVHHPPDGSLHLIPVKSQETGTVETMQTQLPNQSLDVPDGLYPQDHNSRTQDTLVEPSGTHSAPLATGVVQRPMLHTLASCSSLMAIRPPTISRIRNVFVPSGV